VLGNLNGFHLLIILAVVLLLFGAPKLPGLARSLGQSARILKSEMKTMKDDNDDPGSDTPAASATKTPTKSKP
jgi:sec-independent protein translocase protein TatA